MNYYAGIGSRETPKDVLVLFEKVATYLANKGFILRSGGASGADKAFEIGCDNARGRKEIYLPWQGFEGSSSDLVVNSPLAFELAGRFHPYWNNLSNGARKLHTRNSHQVLGRDLNTPSKFIICWTKNGSGSGGTGQAIRIAKFNNIPIFDAGKYKDIDEMRKELKLFLDKYM